MERENKSRDRKAEQSEKKANGWLPIAAFAFGVGILVFIVYFIGLETIYEPLEHIGLGFFWIVALNGLRHLLRAVNLLVAVPRRERNFTLANAFAARLAGETINTVAFTGPILGDAAKAAMLRRKIPLEHSATAVIVDEIIYYVSSLLMILVGALVVLYFQATGISLQLVLFGLIIFSVVTVAGMWWAIGRKVRPVSWVLKKTGHRWFVPPYVKRRRNDISEVEENVLHFKDERPREFFIISAIVISTHLLSVVEAYMAAHMLGIDVTWVGAFVIESLTKAVNFIFFLIPGTIGAYEGGNGLIFTSLGFTAGAGVALALVRRGAIILWTIAGGIILLWRGAKDRAEELAETE